MTVARAALLGAAGRDAGGGGGATAYRAFRLRITEDQGSDRMWLDELYFYASDGGDDLVVTIGGSEFASNVANPQYAFNRSGGEAGDFSFDPPEIIGWDFGSGNEQTLYSYAVKGGGTTNRPPKAWKLQGSNDTTTGLDGTWTDLDSQSGQTWTPRETKTFVV